MLTPKKVSEVRRGSAHNALALQGKLPMPGAVAAAMLASIPAPKP